MYSSQMHTRGNRDPVATCFPLLGLQTYFAPESPIITRRAWRVSESRSSPACCRRRGKHSEEMRYKEDHPIDAIRASSSWRESDVTSSQSWALEVTDLGVKVRPPPSARL